MVTWGWLSELDRRALALTLSLTRVPRSIVRSPGEMPEHDDGPPVVSKPLDDDPDRGIRKQPAAYSGDQTPAAPLEEK